MTELLASPILDRACDVVLSVMFLRVMPRNIPGARIGASLLLAGNIGQLMIAWRHG